MTAPAEGGRFVRGLSEAQLLYLENLGNDLMVEVLAQVADHYADLLVETAAAKGAITAAAGEAPPPDGLPPGASYVDPQDLAGIAGATSAAISETVLPLVAEVYLSNATRVRAGMIEASGWNLPPVSSIDAYRYLRASAPMFDEIGPGLWQNVRDELADGFVQGESIPMLAERVRNAAGTSARTATLVARTSVIDAANHGSIETARASGLVMQKEWMATPDRRTRPTHRAADGQRVDLNAKFSVGGWPADHPGAMELPDNERRLCRCAIGYVIPDSQPAPTSLPGQMDAPSAEVPGRRPEVPATAQAAGVFGPPPAQPVLSGDAPAGWWWELPPGDTGPNGVRVLDLNVDGRRVPSATAFRFDGVEILIEHPEKMFGSPSIGRAVAQVRKLHAETPHADVANLRYVLAAGSNPMDPFWAEKYKMPKFESRATAGRGMITFWNYRPQTPINAHTFEHETGHNLDHYVGRDLFGAESPEWRAAGLADAAWSSRIAGLKATHPDLVSRKSTLGIVDAKKPYPVGVTNYGRSSPAEDFAESNMLHSSGQPIARGVLPGDTTERDLTFRDIFPERAAILDQVYGGTRRFGRAPEPLDEWPSAPVPTAAQTATKTAARTRMAAVQAAKVRAAALNEIDELGWRAPGNATALDQVLDLHVAAKTLTKADATAIREAAGDRTKLTAVLTRIGTRGKLSMSPETAGDLVKFDPARMRTSDGTVPAAGNTMRVIRRGAVLERDGERIEMEPVLVRPADVNELERDRRAKVSGAEDVANVVATIRHEMTVSDAVNPDWVVVMVDRYGLPKATRDALVKAAGQSREALTKATAAALRAAKVKASGVVGRGVPFDPDTQEVRLGLQVEPGQKVKVIETGYIADIDGVPTVVKRTLVEPVPAKVPAQRKALAVKAQPAKVDRFPLASGMRGPTAVKRQRDRDEIMTIVRDRGEGGAGFQGDARVQAQALESGGWLHYDERGNFVLTGQGREYLASRDGLAAQPVRRPGPTTAIGDDEFSPTTRASANRSLADRVKAGFDESTAVRPPQGVSAKTRRIQLADGSYAYRKEAQYGDDVNSEYLGNLVSQAIGAPTPGVYRVNRLTLWLEDVPGQTGGRYLDIPGATPLDMHPDGRLIGLSDSLIDISDRNPGNFIYTPAGRVVGIDNYGRRLENPMRDGEALPSQGLVGKNAYGNPQNPFVYRGGEGFVMRSGDRTGDPDVWRPDNDLTLDEITEMRARLLALRPEFVKLKMATWHKEIMARFEAVAARSRFHVKQKADGPPTSLAELEIVKPPTPRVAAEGANPNYGQTGVMDAPTYRDAGRAGQRWTSDMGPPPLGAFEENCSNVVHAFEMRMRGYEIEAAPLDVLDKYGYAAGRTFGAGRGGTNELDDLLNESWTLPNGKPHGRGFAGQKWRSFADIDREVAAWPEGGRGAIFVGKHIFSVINVKGRAVYYEGQFDANATRNVTALYRKKFGHGSNSEDAKLIRLDDLVPTDAILQAIRPRSLA